MTTSDKIITATRLYCLEISKEDLSAYYWIAIWLLNGVEYLVGQQFSNIDECKARIKEHGTANLYIETKGFTNERQIMNVEKQKQKFLEFVERIEVDKLNHIKPLPYRRRLKEKEVLKVRNDLEKYWNFDGGYWEPLLKCSPKPYIYFDRENLQQEDFTLIIKYLLNLGERRIYEIAENRIDYKIDSSELDSVSSEKIYTSKSNQWIIYFSHESSVAFGGENFISDIEKILIHKLEFKNIW